MHKINLTVLQLSCLLFNEYQPYHITTERLDALKTMISSVLTQNIFMLFQTMHTCNVKLQLYSRIDLSGVACIYIFPLWSDIGT